MRPRGPAVEEPVRPPTPGQLRPSAAAAPPADLSPPIDLAGILESMKATPSPISGSGIAGETQLDGDAFDSTPGSNSAGGDSETTAMLFGISGSGSRFVYVFDRSDSMNGFGGRPLRAAKSELIRSLRSLTERQRFQIIFYNDKPTPFKPSGMALQLIAGEESLVAIAENYIRSIAAFGGTEHDGALKMALRMAPDVIFFLTDARIPRLSSAELREIKLVPTASAQRFTPSSSVPIPWLRRTAFFASWQPEPWRVSLRQCPQLGTGWRSMRQSQPGRRTLHLERSSTAAKFSTGFSQDARPACETASSLVAGIGSHDHTGGRSCLARAAATHVISE